MTDAAGVTTLDHAKAHVTHWLKSKDGTNTSTVIGSTKAPLEGRVWLSYKDQPSTDRAGPSSSPTRMARLLDDGSTQETVASHNELGQPLLQTDPLGRTTTFSYHPNGIDLHEVRQQVEPGITELLGKYDGYVAHRPQTITDAAGQAAFVTYNTRGQVDQVTNARNEVTKVVFAPFGTDGYGKVQSVTRAFGTPFAAAVTFTYDAAHRLASVTDEEGYTLTYGYDAIGGQPLQTLDRITRVTYPDASYEETTWNVLSPEWRRDRRGRMTHFVHDALGRVEDIVEEVNGPGATRTTHYEWCACGALDSITDPNMNVTSWVRDLQYRITGKKIGTQTVATYVYENTTSRLKSVTDALSQVAAYSYKTDDQLASVTYTNEQRSTPDVSYTYDPDYPRLSSMTTSGLGTASFTYVPINPTDTVLGDGQVASHTPVWGSVMNYAYDELGRIKDSPVARSVVYDALGRTDSFTNPLGSFDPVYVANTARVDFITYPDQQKRDYEYHSNLLDKRLKEIVNLGPTGGVISKFNYLYETTGEIKEWTHLDSAMYQPQKFTLGYDDVAQLKTADLTDAFTATPIQQYSYGYDGAANRTSEQVGAGVTTFAPNGFNQIATQSGSGGARTLAYDLNGAMTSNGAGHTYEWDAAGRLSAINYTSSGQRTELSYDGWGRRVKIVEKTSGSVTSEKRYVWEGMAIRQELNGSNTSTRRYYPQGEIHDAEYFGYPSAPPPKLLYTRDHLGSVRELVELSGAVSERKRFDPYGRLTNNVSYHYATDIGYTGHLQHGPSGLTLAPFRAYDADLARWLSRDPIGEEGGLNLYAYVENDPVDLIDELGMQGARPGA